MAHPEGFPRYFIPAGHSLALKLRKACFRLLIVEPSGRVQIPVLSHGLIKNATQGDVYY